MSIISSTFTDFHESGMEDDYDDHEPPEMKYTPVKNEVPDDAGAEQDAEDDFMRGTMHNDETEENTIEQENTVIPQRRTSGRMPRMRVKVRLLNEDDSLDEFVEGGNDREWSPEEDDWAPDKLKRKRQKTFLKGSVTSKNKGGDGPRKKMSLKEQKDKVKERMSKVRAKKWEPKSEETSEESLGTSEYDKEWKIEETDGASVRPTRKSRSTAAKKATTKKKGGASGSRGPRKRMSSEERRQKDRERSARTRARNREQREKYFQTLDKSSDLINMKSEIDDSEDGSKSRGSSVGEDGKLSAWERAKLAKAARKQRMTPEEREIQRAKDRERARLKRAQLRNANDPEALKKLEEQQTRARERARLRRAILKETESEKLDEERTKAREKMRIKRTSLREASSEDAERKLEEMREKSRERMREIRELAKQGALPEDRLRSIEIQKEKDRERKRAKRAAMTPEEKKIEFQKNYFYRISKRSRLPEEEKRAIKMKEYMQKQAKLAEETSEEREQRMEKLRERGRLYYQRKKDTLDREKLRERQRKWWHGMDPEKKRQYKERYREMYRKRIEMLKEDPEKWAEIRKQWTERDKMYREQRKRMIYVRRRRKIDNPENKEVKKRKASTNRKKWAGYTGEQREKYNERRRERELKKKLAIQKLLDSGMTMEQIKQQTETPEQRERRCIQMRIRKARRVLRTRLESLGATPEEIKQREEELRRTYQPIRQFRPYKPRPDIWKRVDPNEVSKLEAEGKLDDLIKTEPLALLPKPRSRKPKLPAPDTPVATAPITTSSTEPVTNVISPAELPQKKRGRPRSSPIQKQQINTDVERAASQPTVIIQNQQQQPSSFSVPTLQPCPQTNYSHSQYHGHPSSSYHHHHSASSSQAVFQYPHQQQLPQHNSQNHYSLQNILDGLAYHQHQEAGTPSGYIPNSSHPQHQQTTYSNYDSSATSSQHEYGSSYHENDNYDTPYSPPASPAGTDDVEELEDHSNYINSDKRETTLNSSTTTINTRPTTDEPTALKEKDKKPKKKKFRPYKYQPSKNPNAKLRGSRVLHPEKRTIFCDQCTASFTLASSLDAHKKQLHNPDYDIPNRLCRLCGETFKHAQGWFSHYYNVHVKPKIEKPKPFVCDLCGAAFMSLNYLEKHQYYQHGEGMKLENHQTCPVPSCQKLFKTTTNFNNHMLRFHSDHNFGTIECYRCDETFSAASKLKEHVQEFHPESYFPCPDCNTVRFTELGLFGHIRHGRCSTVHTDKKTELKEQFSMDKMMLTCELCNKKMVLGSLGVHYRGMHGAKEDLFQCALCKKQFRSREFWAIHLEEKHQTPMEEIIKTVRTLNMANREGISLKPLTRRRPRGKKVKTTDGNKRSRKKTRSTRKRDSDDDEEEQEDTSETEDEWTSDDVVEKAKGLIEKSLKKVRRRRKVTVIAEEDELESQPSSKVEMQ